MSILRLADLLDSPDLKDLLVWAFPDGMPEVRSKRLVTIAGCAVEALEPICDQDDESRTLAALGALLIIAASDVGVDDSFEIALFFATVRALDVSLAKLTEGIQQPALDIYAGAVLDIFDEHSTIYGMVGETTANGIPVTRWRAHPSGLRFDPERIRDVASWRRTGEPYPIGFRLLHLSPVEARGLAIDPAEARTLAGSICDSLDKWFEDNPQEAPESSEAEQVTPGEGSTPSEPAMPPEFSRASGRGKQRAICRWLFPRQQRRFSTRRELVGDYNRENPDNQVTQGSIDGTGQQAEDLWNSARQQDEWRAALIPFDEFIDPEASEQAFWGEQDET